MHWTSVQIHSPRDETGQRVAGNVPRGGSSARTLGAVARAAQHGEVAAVVTTTSSARNDVIHREGGRFVWLTSPARTPQTELADVLTEYLVSDGPILAA